MAKKTASTTTTGPSLSFLQGGVEVSSVQKGVEFSILGSGFAPSDPEVNTSKAKVCLTGQLCVRTPVAADGSFEQAFTLYGAGTYTVHVYQGTSPDDPPLQYEGTLTVTD